jgi:hypothetical protein
MKRTHWFIFLVLILIFTSCGTFQSMVKSTFPYKATFLIPRSAPVKELQSGTAIAVSFDQSITKDGKPGSHIKDIRVVDASLKSYEPSDFNIGNLVYVKVYMSKEDGTNEVLLASRTDITPGVGNSMVLDTYNITFIDELIKETRIRIRMEYQLRNHINTNASLHLVLNVSAKAAN